MEINSNRETKTEEPHIKDYKKPLIFMNKVKSPTTNKQFGSVKDVKSEGTKYDNPCHLNTIKINSRSKSPIKSLKNLTLNKLKAKNTKNAMKMISSLNQLPTYSK
jgi:hypothetical protein